MLTVAHISDLHFGSYLGMPHFNADLKDISLKKVNAAKPDIVVITGDLTAAGHPDQYEEFLEFMKLIKCKDKLIVPGNHDAHGDHGLKYFRHHLGDTQSILRTDEIEIVGVDSTEEPDVSKEKHREETVPHWEELGRIEKGFIGPEDYDWIKYQLGKGQKKCFRIVAMHHHLIGVPGTGINTSMLIDTGDALNLYLDSGVNLVLAGHKHKPWHWQLNDMHILHAGSLSSKILPWFPENSFNTIEIDKKVVIKQHLVQSNQTDTIAEFDNPHA